MPDRRSIWGRTRRPRPRVNRPRDSFRKVQALMAATAGPRGNAIATPVVKCGFSVACVAGERCFDPGLCFGQPGVRARSPVPGHY